MRGAGPAHVIVGEYEGVRSPVPTWEGSTTCLSRCGPLKHGPYQPPAGHSVAWLAVSGAVDAGGR